MPKIIENLRQRLLEEARAQVNEFGYSALTIRSVAKKCGVGIGTVYNYFQSKDALVAAFMLDDWMMCIAAIEQCRMNASSAQAVLRCTYDQLTLFMDKHQAIFGDQAAAESFSGAPSPYHSMLRRQLSEPIGAYCPNAFTAEFIAESLLTWTVAGKSFEDIYSVIEKIL